MAKIYTPYGEKRPAAATCPGNRMEPHFIELYDQHGHPYLEQDGETDTYAKIQSFKEECDIHYLLARYAAGDSSMIHSEAVYMDVTQLPGSMAEMMNYMIRQKERFYELPLEIREKFGHSFEAWAAQAGTDDWIKKMGIVKPAETLPEGGATQEAAPNES